jgi:hypothetical protein
MERRGFPPGELALTPKMLRHRLTRLDGAPPGPRYGKRS